jgi:hypothetical protein
VAEHEAQSRHPMSAVVADLERLLDERPFGQRVRDHLREP